MTGEGAMTDQLPRIPSTQSGELVDARYTTVALHCPACNRYGTFEPIKAEIGEKTTLRDFRIGNPGDSQIQASYWGFVQRTCPFRHCRAHVFVILKDNEVITSFPPERIDFDTEGIPPTITQTLEEAITCHANRCYVASAIMVRRTLEEICEDRGATGDNLWKRIKNLRNKIIISEGLLEGMGNLMLLGNDAAHVKSRTFDKVSREEVEISIEITKKILEAVFQEKNLVERLNSLKKQKL
jgi:hypothetical protein